MCQFGTDICACVLVKAECPRAFCRSVSGEPTASEPQLQEKIKTSRPGKDKVTLLRLFLHPSIRHLPALLFPFSITQTAGCQAFKKQQQISTSGKYERSALDSIWAEGQTTPRKQLEVNPSKVAGCDSPPCECRAVGCAKWSLAARQGC